MAVLGLRFCARAFSSCGKWGPFFIAVRGPLTIAASLVAEHGPQTRRLSNCGSRAQLLHGMWDLPRPGFEPCPLHWQADSQPLCHQGSPLFFLIPDKPSIFPSMKKLFLEKSLRASCFIRCSFCSAWLHCICHHWPLLPPETIISSLFLHCFPPFSVQPFLQWFSHLVVHQDHPEGLLDHRLLASPQP